MNSGIAPLGVEFDFGWYSLKEIQSLTIDFEGDGIVDIDSTDVQESYSTTYNQPGIYQATISVTDADGTDYTKTAVILVQNTETMDQLFRSTWNGMNQALVTGDLATAARYLDNFGNRKYQPVFEVLLDQMPQIISSYTSFKQVDINSEVTIYALNRLDGTRNRVYFVYFMQDRTGIWKIHSM